MKKRFLMVGVLAACMLVTLTACSRESQADESLSDKTEADISEVETVADRSANVSADDAVDISDEEADGSEENDLAGFIFPDSDSRYLETSDLQGLSEEECRIARNEIYARHGRIFQDGDLQAYFEQFGWYEGLYDADEFDESILNGYEKTNRDLIIKYESETGFNGAVIDYSLYGDIIRNVRSTFGEDCEYALYDIDNDGIKELITSQGSFNADWYNTVYTMDVYGNISSAGDFYGAVLLYAADDGNGIYSVYGHMGHQLVERITKSGEQLYIDMIIDEETEEYYENENPIPLTNISDLSVLK